MNKIYDFAKPSDPLLNQRSSEVLADEIQSQEIQSLIDGILAMAKGEQGDAKKKTMVGLAAPQIGVGKRVIIVGIDSTGMGDAPEFKVYINPVIVKRSRETEEGREGCYSTDKVCGIVERNVEVTVEALDRKGNKVLETHKGFPAKIFLIE